MTEKYIFSVTQSLLMHDGSIDSQMQSALVSFASNNEVHLVTIKGRQEIDFVLGDEILDNVRGIFSYSGNFSTMNEILIDSERPEFPEKFFRYFTDVFSKSDYVNKKAPFFSQNYGTITISIPGFSLTEEEIAAYSEWNALSNERDTIIKNFNKKFGENYTAYPEKKHEIVIASNVKDKTQVLNHILNKGDKITFFGSGMPDHSDYKLFKKVQSLGGTSIHVNSWRDTLAKI